MFHNPLFDLYFKHERGVHDFFVQAVFLLIVYLIDGTALFVFHYNQPLLSLLVYVLLYFATRDTIRLKKKKKLFGGFVKYGWKYCLFLAISAWVIYLVMVRIPRLHG